MNTSIFALKGHIIHTPTPKGFEIFENSYVVCKKDTVIGIFKDLPEQYQAIPVFDYSGKLIIPGMADIHQHAPQYGFRGLGMALDLDSNWNTWFMQYSLPEERHFNDLNYAELAYEKFTNDLLRSTTTRTCTFATIHRPATELLMQKLADKGFAAYVGKLNMDRNSIEGLQETTEESLRETRTWLENTCEKYEYVKPMITPRYIPSCTDACMEGMQALIHEFGVPTQSHLSEGLDEIEWVKQLKPEISFYGQAYDMYDMLGSVVQSVQAHCVFPTPEEFELMSRRKKLWVAHCPQSNMNANGVAAPIRRYLDAGIHVGLGTDIAGSNTLSMFRTISDTIVASKIYWNSMERKGDPFAEKTYLTVSEAFYLATKGGCSFWGKAGSFEEGSLFDAVVIDDAPLWDFNNRSLRQRIERVVFQGDERHTVAKFINGRKVYG